MNTVPAIPTPVPGAVEAAALQAFEARRHVERLRNPYPLPTTAVIVIAISMIVNCAPRGRLWFTWGMLGFAIAVVFMALGTVGRGVWLRRDLQERKVCAYLHTQRR